MSSAAGDPALLVRALLKRTSPHLAQKIDTLPPTARIWDVVDSLSILDLVADLEDALDLVVEPIDFIPENFGSIDRIVQYLARRAPVPPRS